MGRRFEVYAALLPREGRITTSGGDAKALMQTADHGEREASFPV